VIFEEIKHIYQNLKVIRIGKGPTNSTAVKLIMPERNSSIDLIVNKLHGLDSSMMISFFEAKINW